MVLLAPNYGVQISCFVISLVTLIRAKSPADLYDGKLSFNLGLVMSHENDGPIRIRRFNDDQGQSARRAKIYEKATLRMKEEDDSNEKRRPIFKNLEPHIDKSAETSKKPRKQAARIAPSDLESDDEGMKYGGSTRGMRPDEFEPESGEGSSGQSLIARGNSEASNDEGKAKKKEDNDGDNFRK